MNTDSIADYITRIRNAASAGHRIVKIPSSGVKKKITKILLNQGFILGYRFENHPLPQGCIKIALKYNCGIPVIKCIKRISSPGLRKYCNNSNIPRVLSGLGIAIISTSQGVITDKEARRRNIGGEILCYVY